MGSNEKEVQEQKPREVECTVAVAKLTHRGVDYTEGDTVKMWEHDVERRRDHGLIK